MFQQMFFGGGLPRVTFLIHPVNGVYGGGGWSGVRIALGGSFTPAAPMLGPSVLLEAFSFAGSGEFGTSGSRLVFATAHPYTGQIRVRNLYTFTRQSDTVWTSTAWQAFLSVPDGTPITLEQLP